VHRTREELLHLTIGGILGAIAGAFFATLLRPLFPIPAGAVGWITVHPYPKDWDVAVAALIVAGSFAGALVASRRVPPLSTSPAARPKWIATAAVVFVAVCVLHDRPYAPLDLYHDGEHLSPAFVVRGGGTFHRDVWPIHGIAADGGLDLMVLGEPPSPVRVRRLRTIIERCMNVDPKSRYPSAADLRRELERLLVDSGARSNHRQRIIGFLRSRNRISETESLTCLNAADLLETVSLELPRPTSALVRGAGVVAASAVGAGTALWLLQHVETWRRLLP
jgi:serine/threonine protein kinase